MNVENRFRSRTRRDEELRTDSYVLFESNFSFIAWSTKHFIVGNVMWFSSRLMNRMMSSWSPLSIFTATMGYLASENFCYRHQEFLFCQDT